MTTDEQAGVALVSGQSKTLKADRNAQPLWVQVNDAWVVPALITPQFDGASGAVALEPADLNWVDVEGEVQGSSDHALLMVEVSFRPGESNAAMLVQLDEWRLSSNLATPPAGARGSARMFFDHPRPKFIGLAKWNATDNVLEAPQSDLLQLETVNYTMPAAEARAQLRDQQQAFFVADEAVWKFEDTGKTARATLVFMVPALSRPWNYALRYGSGGGSASSGTGAGGGAGGGSVGLYRNVVTDLSPLKLTVNNVTRTLRIEGLTLDPLPVGQSYITVDLRVEHHGDHPILLRAEDLLLSYKQGEGQRGMLLEKLSAPRKGVPLKGDTRVLNTSVNAGENPFLTVNEDETAGLRLAPQWSSYMRLKSNSTLRLVYVFPAVAAFGDFEFVLAGTLTEEPPEWFLMQESKKASHSVTHGISLGDVRTSLAESFILENGRTRTQRLEVGAQEYLIIP